MSETLHSPIRQALHFDRDAELGKRFNIPSARQCASSRESHKKSS
ncbi:MAG TPA: hypothetical protein V6C81_23985 [Planktothrix sp.]